MTKLCKNCKITNIRDKATFCSDKCRKAYSRNSDKSDKSDNNSDKSDKSDIPITNKSDKTQPGQDIVQDEQDDRTMIPGKLLGRCKVCKEPQPHKLVDICYKCVAIKYGKIRQGNK